MPPTFARSCSFVACVALFLTSSCGAQNRPRTVSETRSLLGTFVTITVSAPDQASAEANVAASFKRIEALEQTLSARRADSELSVAMETAVREPAPLSDDLYRAMAAGIAWHERSGGVFDITVSPLLNLWRQCAEEKRLPTPGELEHARGQLGVDALLLDEKTQTLQVSKETLSVDLGGLGKGFCANEVHTLLEERGATSALIAIAGDIYALGHKPDGSPWRVGVQDPRRPKDPNAVVTVLLLSDKAVSTSGNYQRYVEIDGKRYSHIVDPRTGLTAENVPSVTVIGPDTLTTDILGTALSVLGVKDGLAMIEEIPSVEALFITFDENDQPAFVRSSGFSAYEVTANTHTDYLK